MKTLPWLCVLLSVCGVADAQTYQRPNELSYHLSGQHRVLALIFEIAAVARLASDVDAAAQGDVILLVAQLAADQLAVFKRELRVPGGGLANGGRQQRGVAPAVGGAPHPDRRIGQLQVRKSQPGYARDHPGAPVGMRARGPA